MVCRCCDVNVDTYVGSSSLSLSRVDVVVEFGGCYFGDSLASSESL